MYTFVQVIYKKEIIQIETGKKRRYLL